MHDPLTPSQSLASSVAQIRALARRNNGDLEHSLDGILAEMDKALERLRAREGGMPIWRRVMDARMRHSITIKED